MKALAGILFALPVAGTVQAAPTEAASDALAHCVAIDAPAVRLACYDAAAGRRDAGVGGTRSAAPDLAAKREPAALDVAGDAREFGLSSVQRKVAPTGPESIDAHIVGLSADRIGHALVTLDNGQTWSVTEEDGRLGTGQRVTIRRAALGSFLMTTPDHHTYTVRRTR